MSTFNLKDYDGVLSNGVKKEESSTLESTSEPVPESKEEPSVRNEAEVTITGNLSDVMADALMKAFPNTKRRNETDRPNTYNEMNLVNFESVQNTKPIHIHVVDQTFLRRNSKKVVRDVASLNMAISQEKHLLVCLESHGQPFVLSNESWALSNIRPQSKKMTYSVTSTITAVKNLLGI